MLLHSYRVLDLCEGGALLCGQILGDLGAGVVVVEPPGGSPSRQTGPFLDDRPDPEGSLYWWSLNRNKRGITLDLETAPDRNRLKALVRDADFLLESFEPGHLEQLGLGFEVLSELNPGLVMVSITPFGQSGLKARWPGCDLTAYASSGALIRNGDDDRPPVGLAVPQAFLHAGAEAAVGALIAHLGRQRDGMGQHVDVSAQTAMMMATQANVLAPGWGDVEARRMTGGWNVGGIPLRLIYPARDGHVAVTLFFGSAVGPFTRRLMETLYHEGVIDENMLEKDWVNYASLIQSGAEPVSELIRCQDLIAEFTSRYTKDELFAIALDRRLLIVPIATIEELAGSAQLSSRNFWHSLSHTEIGREITYPGPFVKSTIPIQYTHRPPRMGEHNEEVLAGLSLDHPPRHTNKNTTAREMPLRDIKILDLSWVVATPWATRYLADYGATVVKVESPSHLDPLKTMGPFKDRVPGPDRSGCYATVNAGKMGITLDLASPSGRELALRLAQWADVVTESFAPGTLAKLGLDYPALSRVNPDLIMLSSCLNGQTGPLSRLAGYGTMGLHIAGFGTLAGWPDRAPAGPAGAYTDYVAPKFTAAAILAAIDHHSRTGQGCYLDLSQVEASLQFLAPAILHWFTNGAAIARCGNFSPAYAPHGVYPAAGNDRWIAIAVLNDGQWHSLCRVLGRMDWASDRSLAEVGGRLGRVKELDAAMSAWTAVREVGSIEGALSAAGIPAHRVSTPQDLWSDPQIAARNHFVSVPHAELGDVPIEASRMVFSATSARLNGAGPVLGQDNDRVLRDILNLGDEEIMEYLAAGALG